MYQVVFTGRLLKGADRASVEPELQRLFKATPRQVDWFLRGKPIVVKSCEEKAQAKRYYDALTKAGLECELRSDQAASASMSPPDTADKPEPEKARQQELPIPAAPEAKLENRQEPRPSPPSKSPPTQAETAKQETIAHKVVGPEPVAIATDEPGDVSKVTGETTGPTGPAPVTTAAVATEDDAPSEPEATNETDLPASKTPKLGPVTQAITEQDRAPQFSSSLQTPARPEAPAAIAPQRAILMPTEEFPSGRWKSMLGFLFLLIGAVLVGALAYLVQEEWQARQLEIKAAQQQSAGTPPAQDEPSLDDPALPETPQTPEALIVGRWQCLEDSSGRVVENEFMADGRYRSLAHGREDAFQQVDQMDVLVEGSYRLEGDLVVLHVQHIPSREAFGSSPYTDEYLYWRIDQLTADTLLWSDTKLDELSESCLRSVSLESRRQASVSLLE